MIRIKNIGQPQVYAGLFLNQDDDYLIPQSELSKWANDSQVLQAVLNGALQVYGHDGNLVADRALAISVLRDEQIKRVLPSVSESPINLYRPFGFILQAQANDVSILDFELDKSIRIKGGIIEIANRNIGDYFSLYLIDKNNVLGIGINPMNNQPITPDNAFYIVTYLKNIPAFSGVVDFSDVDLSDLIPQGLFFRIEYHSVGSNAPTILACLHAYET
jgi:hypothetical protein